MVVMVTGWFASADTVCHGCRVMKKWWDLPKTVAASVMKRKPLRIQAAQGGRTDEG